MKTPRAAVLQALVAACMLLTSAAVYLAFSASDSPGTQLRPSASLIEVEKGVVFETLEAPPTVPPRRVAAVAAVGQLRLRPVNATTSRPGPTSRRTAVTVAPTTPAAAATAATATTTAATATAAAATATLKQTSTKQQLRRDHDHLALRAFEHLPPLASATPAHLQQFQTQPHTVVHEFLSMAPRRNHDVVVLNETLLLSFGGRNRPSMELFDLAQAKVVVSKENPLLELNHVASIVVDDEVYVVCALSHGKINDEVNREEMVIIDTLQWTVRDGARLLHPRGACGAAALTMNVQKQDARLAAGTDDLVLAAAPERWQEKLLCVLGGSVGTHDQGAKQRTFDCYSRRSAAWFNMPDLPQAMDHIDAFAVDDSRLIVANGLHENYGKTARSILEFDVAQMAWRTIGETQEPRSAAGSVLFAGRYLLISGGIMYSAVDDPEKIVGGVRRSTIEWFDTKTGKGRISPLAMSKPRFAHRATLAYVHKQPVLLACGGTPEGVGDWQDFGDCEMFGIASLP